MVWNTSCVSIYNIFMFIIAEDGAEWNSGVERENEQ